MFSFFLIIAAPPDSSLDLSWVLLDTQSNVDFSTSSLVFALNYTESYQYYGLILATPLPPMGLVTLVAFCPYNAPVPVPPPPAPSTSQPSTSPVVVPPGPPPTTVDTAQPSTSPVVVIPPTSVDTIQQTTTAVVPGPPPKGIH